MSEALDLFAGPGGWEEGAKSLGLDILGVEVVPIVCETRAAAGHRTMRGDVFDFTPEAFVGFTGLIGSPPCPPYSRQANGSGRRDRWSVERAAEALTRGHDIRKAMRQECEDDRSILVVEPLRWALTIRPQWIALEQVPDVLPLWELFAHYLRPLGYSCWAGVLNSANYGVPQTRERAILIASRNREVGPPPPSHSDQRRGGCLLGLEPWVTMGDALGWVDLLHTNRDQRADGQRQTRPSDEPAPTLTGKSGGQWTLRNGNRSRSAVRGVDEPAPTMHFGNNSAKVEWVNGRPATTVQGDPRIGRPGHKDRDKGESAFDRDAVRVTDVEAAILQGFRPDYPWHGNKTQRFGQIGDAIPPPLAEAILRMAVGC